MNTHATMAALLLPVLLVLQTEPSRSNILPQCRAYLPAEAQLRFAHDKHRRWYRRFWTGSCDGLSTFDFCHSGSPNWREVIERIRRQVPAGEQSTTISKACNVGHLIGFEWAKDNNVRCIHTSDLPGMMRMLESGNMLERLNRLEAQARGKLGCRR
jgi:hypothetical protein